MQDNELIQEIRVGGLPLERLKADGDGRQPEANRAGALVVPALEMLPGKRA